MQNKRMQEEIKAIDWLAEHRKNKTILLGTNTWLKIEQRLDNIRAVIHKLCKICCDVDDEEAVSLLLASLLLWSDNPLSNEV